MLKRPEGQSRDTDNIGHKTQNEHKQKEKHNTGKKIKMSNMDPTKQGVNLSARES